MDKLTKMLNMQREFGRNYTAFGALNDEEKQEVLLDFLGHLDEEKVEMRRELPIRKHWSTKRLKDPDWGKVKEELIDMWHFFMTLFLILEMDTDEIYRLYCKKNAISIKRKEEGY